MKIGLCGAIFLILFVLKLIGVLAWSWWWITAPLWVPIFLVIIVFLAAVLIQIGVK